MIAYLRGVVKSKQPDAVVVDVGGVGYHLHIPLSTFYKLTGDGHEQEFFVHTHVREDQISLFGFASHRELDVFKALISVHGFGPKTALTALSGMETDALVRCVVTSDIVGLCRIPGIGRKTAERLVYELKEKLHRFLGAEGLEAAAGSAASSASPVQDDLVSALLNLDYPRAQAEKAVQQALREQPGAPFEALLRCSLKSLMSK